MNTTRTPRQRRTRPVAAWFKSHKTASIALALVLVAATAVTAAVLIRQTVGVSPDAKAPDIVFAQGTDYSAINLAGFATVTIGSGGTSATFAPSGVAGATLVQLGDVLKVQNTQAALGTDYLVTLTRSAAPDAAITGFTINVYDASDTLVESWDAAAAASGTQFSLPADTTYDISVDIVIAAGTTTGALGSFDILFDIVPA